MTRVTFPDSSLPHYRLPFLLIRKLLKGIDSRFLGVGIDPALPRTPFFDPTHLEKLLSQCGHLWFFSPVCIL